MGKTLQRSLDIKPADVITVVGAGGKTSTIIALVRELIRKRLIITTTTHFNKFKQFYHKEVLTSKQEDLIKKINNILREQPNQKIVIGQKRIDDKIKGIPPS